MFDKRRKEEAEEETIKSHKASLKVWVYQLAMRGNSVNLFVFWLADFDAAL